MGGRGSAGGSNNVIPFPGTNRGTPPQYDYPGIVQSVDRLESKLSKANTNNKIASIVSAIDRQRNVIDAAFKDVDADQGDIRVLYTQRRRLYQLRQKAINKGKFL